MTGKIYVLNQDESLSELIEQPYASEDLLQALLEKYPDLLAGEQIDSEVPRRWLLISREVPVPGEESANQSGYLDHLFVDQDGIPTLIEVKRSSDTRIRREVVGQMLDYAANAVIRWSLEFLRNQFYNTCDRIKTDPNSEIANLLGISPDEEEHIHEFWEKVGTNLLAGKIRMVFVADVIPSSLRRIIEFMGEQMDPAETIGIEVKQYIGDNLKTLVPRIVGSQTKASILKQASKKWDHDTFYSELAKKFSPEEMSIARKIEEWAEEHVSYLWWGEGRRHGSFVPILLQNNMKFQLFAVWTNGVVETYFHWFQKKPPFDSEDKRVELLSRLNNLNGVHLPEDSITRRPNIAFSLLCEENNLENFLKIYEWVISEFKNVKTLK